MIKRDKIILDFIIENGSVTTTQILDHLGMDHRKSNFVIISRRTRSLLEKGLIDVEPREVGSKNENIYKSKSN